MKATRSYTFGILAATANVSSKCLKSDLIKIRPSTRGLILGSLVTCLMLFSEQLNIEALVESEHVSEVAVFAVQTH